MATLETYRRKRNFEVTQEPRGKAGKRGGHSFVVQKHAARRLHYDFRLELDGVLKSWALAKGPSLVPGERRLAVHVEDHPLDYGGFEGTIPAGQYGAGTVMVWDRGTWTPKGDAHAGYKKGRLDFTLDGEKLKGAWHLVRMRAKAGERGDNWLLIKSDDDAARSADETDILDDAPRSVVTHRSIEEIAGDAKSKPRNSGRRARQPAGRRAKPPPATPVRLSHPDRVLWPESGITKQGLADYYISVWPFMERHVTARPLALVRCPAGITQDCFFQKHEWNGMGAHVKRIVDPHDKERIVGIEDLDGLLALVQASVLEIHPWGARMEDLDHPDRLIFDFDPGPAPPVWSATGSRPKASRVSSRRLAARACMSSRRSSPRPIGKRSKASAARSPKPWRARTPAISLQPRPRAGGPAASMSITCVMAAARPRSAPIRRGRARRPVSRPRLPGTNSTICPPATISRSAISPGA
jgi:bifunctional non-homologous end joining protein LigD